MDWNEHCTYIERERESERERGTYDMLVHLLHIYIHTLRYTTSKWCMSMHGQVKQTEVEQSSALSNCDCEELFRAYSGFEASSSNDFERAMASTQG